MTTAAWIWVIGYPFAVVAIMVEQEIQRRRSSDPFERAATLRPALDGVIAGTVWPLLVACAVALGFLVVVASIGRAVAGFIESLVGPSEPDEEF